MIFRDTPMSLLFTADPETAVIVQEELKHHAPPISEEELAVIVNDTIWGLSQETALGHAIAAGLIELSGLVAADLFEMYRACIREAGARSAFLGRIMAIHLLPVIRTEDRNLIGRFMNTAEALQKIGAYTLQNPFETLSALLKAGDTPSAAAFMTLLTQTLSPELSYNQCKHLCHLLSKAAISFPKSRRCFQIEQLTRIAGVSPSLAESFLDGMERGLGILNTGGLGAFVADGLNRYHQNHASGIQFLSLESRLARETAEALQVAVSFSQVRRELNRYLQARTGAGLSVQPMSESPLTAGLPYDAAILACSQGNHICLPDEIEHFSDRAENRNLYKCLTRFEACHHEFGTYDFDIEMATDLIRQHTGKAPIPDGPENRTPMLPGSGAVSDTHRFYEMFPNPALAADLLAIFEEGRIRIILKQRYPGIVHRVLSLFLKEAMMLYSNTENAGPPASLYLNIALGASVKVPGGEAVIHAFDRTVHPESRVEDSAVLVWKTYADIAALPHMNSRATYRPLKTPFGLRPWFDMALDAATESSAAMLKDKLLQKGVRVYKSDVRKLLKRHDGDIRREDLLDLVRNSGRPDVAETSATAIVNISGLDLSDVIPPSDTGIPDAAPAAWYREWDCIHSDYLDHYTRVVDRCVEGADAHFYDRVLQRYRELVSQIRYAFELMKPEGLKLLRNWTEGDELDYRAMLDFVLDRKSGHIPSDRLYIKRLKQERDVAALLLMDVSRSTGNSINGLLPDGGETVLRIEKESAVLFCEALHILGDNFAVAGFSGNGRLAVDYYHIKNFDESLNDTVRRRISGLTPQRSTRMGAAIRHAAACLDAMTSRVKLLILLGDGFPNDVGYKQDYAIGDTRKAITEALSRQIHTYAITVNMACDTRLDDLYGTVHHSVLSDVRELPSRLLSIYSALTRTHAASIT